MEFQQEREYSSFNIRNGTRTNLANHFGPTIHYGGKAFFATATFLEQLRGAQDYPNPAPGFIVNGRTMPMTSKSFACASRSGSTFKRAECLT